MNKYDNVLKRAINEMYNCPEWMKRPRPHNDFIIATDRRILIRIDKSKVENPDEYAADPYQPTKFDRIFPQRDCSFKLSLDEFVPLINGVPEEEYINVHGKIAECSDCSGKGRVLWKYESEDGDEYEDYFDCPVCNGRGKFDRRLLSRYQRNIKINGVLFAIDIVIDALEAINDLGHKTATVTHIAPGHPMLIDVEPGVSILLMSNDLETEACSITLKPTDR